MDNSIISEKSQRKEPENEKVRHHLLSKVTQKINYIKNEIKGHEQNIAMHQEQINVLTGLIKNRKNNLEQYEERKKFLQEYQFTDKEEIKEDVIEQQIEAPEKKEEEEKTQEVDELTKLLHEKGFKKEDLIDKLKEL